MGAMLQIPQILGSALASDPSASGLYGLLRPFLEDLAKRQDSTFRVHVGQPTPFTAPTDWILAGTGQWNFGPNWAQWSDPNYGINGKCAMRKGEDGFVEVAGLWDNVDNTTTGGNFVVFPTGSLLAPAPGSGGILTTNAFMTHGTGFALSNALVHNTGTVLQWTSLQGWRWPAASRAPIPWARPLQVTCPFTPSLILLVAETQAPAVAEAQVLLPRWRAGRKGPEIYSCPGLVPLASYRLTPWCLAL